MHTGEKIRHFRINKGYSQEYMATQLDTSLTRYGQLERGDTEVKIPELQKIAEILGTNEFEILAHGEKNVFYVANSGNSAIGYIYGGTVNMNPNIDVEKILLQLENIQLRLERLENQK